MRRNFPLRLTILMIPCLAITGCGSDQSPSLGAAPVFEDQSAGSGLDFVHFNGMSGELYFPEMMGAGAAVFDYDNDGDLDIYFVQGNMLGPDMPLSAALVKPAHPIPLSDRLYRNDMTWDNGKPALRFTDVTEQAGLSVAQGYGMGVAVGDFDNDGLPDLFLSNFGPNQLLHNQGDGTFVDISQAAGIADPRWSVSASWTDVNRDGLLDLYVGNYVDFAFKTHKPCRSAGGALDYCSPLVYLPQADNLYLGDGIGGFTDVSDAWGVTVQAGGALGVAAADFNADGFTDIYVANDGVANQLWLNQNGKGFVDEAELSGVAVNMVGAPEASMGVAAADFDQDGDVDLFMTHLDRETNTLYINDGKGWFEDRTVASGLGDSSLVFTGFGTGWLDYDGDGLLDLFSANGAVTQISEQVERGEVLPLQQTNQLFRNTGASGFTDISAKAGPAMALSEVSRGAAFGDLDNDGDLDIVVSNNNGRGRLLLNTVGQDRPWLGVRLLAGQRDDFGARVALLSGKQVLAWGRAHTDGSYASASDPRVLFSPNNASKTFTVLVHWTDGSQELWPELEAGRYHALQRGAGATLTEAPVIP